MNKLAVTTLATTAVVGSVLVGGSLVSAQTDEAVDAEGDASAREFGKRGEKRLEVASEVLGISADELRDQIEASSFEDVLADYGYEDRDAFFEATIPVLEERLAEKGLSEEEITEKIENLEERREVKADVSEVSAELLRLTREEVKEAREGGQTFEEILTEQGFADKEDFHAQVAAELETLWGDEGVSDEDIEDRLERLEDRKERREERRERRGEFGPRGFGESEEGADEEVELEPASA